jgi:hypothetical protein
MRLVIAILWLAGVGGGIATAEDVPLPRARPPAWVEPRSFAEAAGLDFNSADVTAKPSDCDLRLAKIAAVEPMPRLIGPGACGGRDMVELDAVLLADHARIALKPAPVLRCAMAEQLSFWLRDEAAPKVATFGAALRGVETYDDFECRSRNRVKGGKLSEHGKGNAVDVRAFTLADGHVIRLTDMAASKDSISPSATTAIASATGWCASGQRPPPWLPPRCRCPRRGQPFRRGRPMLETCDVASIVFS